MASWKKVIVSGSSAHLSSVTASNLTNTNLVIAGTGGALSSSGLTLTGGTLALGATNITSTGGSSVLSGSFSGSFSGTFSGMSSTLKISGSTGGGTVDLGTQTLTVAGTTNQITSTAANQTITLSLPNDVTIPNNLTVTNNLIVQGTASFQETTNLAVADRFVLLASGSNSTGEGGIVVQQATNGVGEVFGWDDNSSRWAVTSSFTANLASFAPDAFMAAAIIGAGTDPTTTVARYNKGGNIFIGTDEAVWIYS